jgi:hypothetical protein
MGLYAVAPPVALPLGLAIAGVVGWRSGRKLEDLREANPDSKYLGVLASWAVPLFGLSAMFNAVSPIDGKQAHIPKLEEADAYVQMVESTAAPLDFSTISAPVASI